MWHGDVGDVTRGLRFEKKLSWFPASERESGDSDLGEARWLCALRAPCVGWVESWRCKSNQLRKIVSLSPHVEKPLNSKRWIKVSYLNQFREFRVFRFPMSISHIRISGYVTYIVYKFEIIWTKIGKIICLFYGINFSKTSCKS